MIEFGSRRRGRAEWCSIESDSTVMISFKLWSRDKLSYDEEEGFAKVELSRLVDSDVTKKKQVSRWARLTQMNVTFRRVTQR